MKNRKSLEAHNQFISGWARTAYQYQKTGSNFLILKAESTPSQRLNEDPHIPWITVNPHVPWVAVNPHVPWIITNPHVPWIAVNSLSTMIETAHCTCMAGLGESCSHIGAILFKIEAAVRAGYTQKSMQR